MRFQYFGMRDGTQSFRIFLTDNSTDKVLEASKKVSLEKQANKLIDIVYNNKLTKSNFLHFHSTGE